MTSNSQNKALKQTLSEFLQGKLSFKQLQEQIDGLMEIDFSITEGHREIYNNKIDGKYAIPVEKFHLQAALEKFLQGETLETELSDWAAFVVLSGVYCPKGASDEEREREAEGVVWEILRRLMVPQVFILSKEAARQYLKSLGQTNNI